MIKTILAEKLSDANQITMSSSEIVDFINTHRKCIQVHSTVLPPWSFYGKVPHSFRGKCTLPNFWERKKLCATTILDTFKLPKT